MPSQDYSTDKEIEQCIELGHDALDRGELVEATTRFVKARLMLKQAGVKDSVELRHCLIALGMIYSQRGMPEEGLEIYRDLRRVDDSLDNRRNYVELLSKIAAQYHKQGDRQGAEEAYGAALAEATELLPADDPLIDKLNNTSIEFFKHTFKAQKLSVSDTNLKLAKLQKGEPVKEPPVLSGQARRPAKRVPKEGDTAARESLKQGLGASQVKRKLRSLIVLACLGLILLVSLAKASLFVSAAKPGHTQTQAHKTGAAKGKAGAAKGVKKGAARGH